MRSLYLVLIFPIAALATVNGHCSGSATGTWKSDGICVSTGTCNSYKGKYISGGCPSDGNDIKCCLIGLETSATTNPCGDYSFCDWTANSDCAADGGHFLTGSCPGLSNYKCCKF